MTITHVRHDNSGTITEYKTDTGQIFNINQAINMVEDGDLEGVEIRSSKNGSRYLRSFQDNNKSNNLDNLPEF